MARVRFIIDRRVVVVFGVRIRSRHLVVVGDGWWLARLVRYALSAALSGVAVGGPLLELIASILEDVGRVWRFWSGESSARMI